MENKIKYNSKGNGSLLVIINNNGVYWDRIIIEETILSDLRHFGFPFRTIDLAETRLTPESAHDCAGIILAQDKLGECLTQAETEIIVKAVEDGVGLVNFDYHLDLYHSSFHKIFGFERINPAPYSSNIIRVRDKNHFITQMQSSGEVHELHRMTCATMVEKWRDDVDVPVEAVLGKEQLVYTRHLVPGSTYEPGNCPVLFSAKLGLGKAVQFTVDSRIWKREFLGHANGLDDLFWRSIAWAVRKPFVANMVPPFITMSFDDCEGRHNFEYVAIANQYGYIPMPSLFIRNVPERLFPVVREGIKTKKALYNTHALDYYNLLVYDFGRGEYSFEQLKQNFAYDDEWWKKIGVSHPRINRFHWGEYGVKALPFLKERNRMFFCPALQMGLMKAEMDLQNGYHPFNLQTLYYDELPDDPDFFAFAAMAGRHQEDFLTGCTVNLLESNYNDIEKAAQVASRQIIRSFRDGFYAELVTHEQKFKNLSMQEWDQILKRTGQLTENFEKIFAGHDEIGSYLKDKKNVWIDNSKVIKDKIKFSLKGESENQLKITIFKDEGDDVLRSYVTAEPFQNEIKIEQHRC